MQPPYSRYVAGFGRNQCLGCMLLEVGASSGCKPRNIIGGMPFPISPGSTLVWLGFTAEGTPASVDSSGVVRLVNRKFCNTWNQVANLSKLVSDDLIKSFSLTIKNDKT